MSTLGEQRIRTNFNPDNNSEVDKLKQEFAKLIDLLYAQLGEPTREWDSDFKTSEKRRLVSIAQTKIEEAAMWAIKAVTI